jgi:hypothetical protein
VLQLRRPVGRRTSAARFRLNEGDLGELCHDLPIDSQAHLSCSLEHYLGCWVLALLHLALLHFLCRRLTSFLVRRRQNRRCRVTSLDVVVVVAACIAFLQCCQM